MTLAFQNEAISMVSTINRNSILFTTLIVTHFPQTMEFLLIVETMEMASFWKANVTLGLGLIVMEISTRSAAVVVTMMVKWLDQQLNAPGCMEISTRSAAVV